MTQLSPGIAAISYGPQRASFGTPRKEGRMIIVNDYEATFKRMPPKKRWQFIRLIMVAILFLSFTMPLTSAAAPETNSFIGSISLPDLMTFTSTGFMNVVRAYHIATLLTNGKVMIAGGYEIGADRLSSAELYDPLTGNWSTFWQYGY